MIDGGDQYKSQGKATAVKNASCPTNVVQLCSLLGFINYFSHFFAEPFNSLEFSESTAQERIGNGIDAVKETRRHRDASISDLTQCNTL